MDLGVHLPLMPFGEPLSRERLAAAVDTARDGGFAAVSANDHFVFQTPWLDGPTALASIVDRSGTMTLATTVALTVLRGPVALAKALAAIDILSEGRLIAAVGPGSSKRDYDLVGISFEQRWKLFDEAIDALRALLGGDSPRPGSAPARRRAVVDRKLGLAGGPRPGRAGRRRLARLRLQHDAGAVRAGSGRPGPRADGAWKGRRRLPQRAGDDVDVGLRGRGRARPRAHRCPRAAARARSPDELRGQSASGPPDHCAELLSRYAQAGCGRVYLWPLGDERRQLERIANDVTPRIAGVG